MSRVLIIDDHSADATSARAREGRRVVSRGTSGRQRLPPGDHARRLTGHLREVRRERQLAEANEQLNKLAREDSLTGLMNRRMIMELLGNEWARWQR